MALILGPIFDFLSEPFDAPFRRSHNTKPEQEKVAKNTLFDVILSQQQREQCFENLGRHGSVTTCKTWL